MRSTRTGLQFAQETLRSLGSDDQIGHVLAAIAREIDGSAAAFDDSGELLGAIGEAPVVLLGQFVSHNDAHAVGHVGRWAVRVRRMGSRGAIALVLATKNDVEVRVEDDFLIGAEIAITAVLGILAGDAERRAREIAQLVEILEHGIAPEREQRFRQRLGEYGFDAHPSYIVFIAEALSGDTSSRDDVRELLEDAAAHGVPLLLATHLVAASSDAVMHGILPEHPGARAWLDRHAQGWSVGVSGPQSTLAEVPRAVREAELAHRVAAERAAALSASGHPATDIAELVDYRRLSPAAWLAAEAPLMEWRVRRRDLLAPLDNQDDLKETIVTYLACDLSVNRAAQALFVHPNTVRYRLERLSALFGDTLHSPFLIADLMGALGADVRAKRAGARQA